MLKKIVIIGILLVIALGFAARAALHSPRLTGQMVVYILKRYWPQGQVRSFSVGSQRIQWPELVFERVHLDVQIPQKGRDPIAIRADLPRLTIFVLSRQEVRLEGEGLDFTLGENQVRNADFLLYLARAESGGQRISGWVKADEVASGKLTISGVSTKVQGADRSVDLHDFAAEAYGGRLLGEISLEYDSGLAYVVQMGFQKLNCEKLRVYKSGIFESLQGDLDGDVHLTVVGEMVKSFAAQVFMPSGGEIRAVFLGFIAQYIPTIKERQTLEALVKADGMVSVEKARAEFKMVDNKYLNGLIHLESRQLNVNLHSPIDMHFDGNVWSLLRISRMIIGH